MRMCKCTAKIVWDWEEQCFAAEYVWEFMSFCDNCWERLCESCWERFCESYWGSGIQVVEGVRIVNVLFTCWRCESFLSVNLIFADTSQNRQNILQLFFQNSSKQLKTAQNSQHDIMGYQTLYSHHIHLPKQTKNIGTWPILQTWPDMTIGRAGSFPKSSLWDSVSLLVNRVSQTRV